MVTRRNASRGINLNQQAQLIDAMDATTGWTPTGCSVAVNNSWFTTGTGSVKLTGSGTATNADITKTGLSIYGPTFESISFDIKVETPTTAVSAWQYITVSMGVGGFTNYFQCQIYLRPGVTQNVTIHKNDFTLVGSAAWTNTIDRLFLRCGAVTAMTTICSIDNIRVNRKLSQAAGVIIGADDCHDDQYDWLYPACTSRGLLLTLYPVRDWVELNANNYSLAQLHEMHDAGVCVCNHSTNHFDALGLVSPNYGHAATYQEAYDNYEAMMDWQIAQGFTRDDEHLFGAYPRGSFNDNVKQACIDLGLKVMRTTMTGYQSQVPESADSMMLANNLSPAGQSGGIAETFAAFQPYLDKAINARQIVELTFHQLISGVPAASDECKQSVATEILDYIQTKIAAGAAVSMNPPMAWNAMRSGAL